MRVELSHDDARKVKEVLDAYGDAPGLASLFVPPERVTAELLPARQDEADGVPPGMPVPTCPNCGGQTFGYAENCIDYRSPSGMTADPDGGGEVVVYWSADGTADSGDSDPGLFCDDWRGNGCGVAIDLPEGWEVGWA